MAAVCPGININNSGAYGCKSRNLVTVQHTSRSVKKLYWDEGTRPFTSWVRQTAPAFPPTHVRSTLAHCLEGQGPTANCTLSQITSLWGSLSKGLTWIIIIILILQMMKLRYRVVTSNVKGRARIQAGWQRACILKDSVARASSLLWNIKFKLFQ